MDSDEPIDIMSVDVGAVGGRVQEVQGLKRERIATWNFSGLCKQKEVYRVRASVMKTTLMAHLSLAPYKESVKSVQIQMPL